MNTLFDLTGKAAIITGASTGLGQGMTLALASAGADVLLVPLYTPLRTDEASQSTDRLALGGINVYLQQKSALFRHTPEFIDRWLNTF